MHYWDISTLSTQLRLRELSPVDVCELMLARIAEHDVSLHSYVAVDAAGARRAARVAEEEIAQGRWRGPLHGVPLAIKDLYALGDAPTGFGSVHLSEHRLQQEAEVVRRLRDAGAVIMGRLRMSEAALTDHAPGEPTPVNPWDAQTWVGTSSSGSAAATAAGLCYGSLGSDTGGSVRGPATATGLSGLKPTRGIVPSAGAIPLSRTLDTVAPFARSANDCRVLFEAIRDGDERQNASRVEMGATRIGIDRAMLAQLDSAIARMIEGAAAEFARLGAEIVDVRVPDGGPLASQWVAFVGYEALTDIGDLYPEGEVARYGPEIAYVLEQGRQVTAGQYAEIEAQAREYTAVLDRVLEHVDAVLLPTIGTPSPTVEQIAEMRRDYATWNEQVMRLTCPFNFSGHPSMTFPTGFTERRTPLGAQLVAGHRSEHLLLSLAEQYQDVTDHHRAHPVQYA